MVCLRELKETEFKEAMILRVRCWDEELNCKGINRLDVEEEIEDLKSWLSEAAENNDFRIVIGAFEADQLLGFASASFAENYDIEENGFELNYLFVHEDYRGQNISIQLLKSICTLFKEKNCNTLVVYNHHEAPSNAYYLHLGGNLMKQLTQGKDQLLIDVFSFDTDLLLETLTKKLPATMVELEKEDRHLLKQLHVSDEEICIQACIEGTMGRAWMNCLKDPSYGLVAVADFCFLLGEPPVPMNPHFIALLAEFGKNQIIMFESKSWVNVIQSNFPDHHKSFKSYSFYWEPERFDQKKLQNYIDTASNTYDLLPFDEALGFKALENSFTADFCMFFESPQKFLEKGLGYAYVHNGDIIAGASSYSACKGAIDITIGTVEAYRRQGLALVCASTLILDCMSKGIYPKWDAANTDSVALAEKLGYRFKEAYTAYTIL